MPTEEGGSKTRSKSGARVFKGQPNARDRLPLGRLGDTGLTVLWSAFFFFVVSSAPFLTVHFLDTMNLVTDVNGDNALLSGAWAVLTLPFAVMIYMIGGIMDAERVVKWFKL